MSRTVVYYAVFESELRRMVDCSVPAAFFCGLGGFMTGGGVVAFLAEHAHVGVGFFIGGAVAIAAGCYWAFTAYRTLRRIKNQSTPQEYVP